MAKLAERIKETTNSLLEGVGDNWSTGVGIGLVIAAFAVYLIPTSDTELKTELMLGLIGAAIAAFLKKHKKDSTKTEEDG